MEFSLKFNKQFYVYNYYNILWEDDTERDLKVYANYTFEFQSWIDEIYNEIESDLSFLINYPKNWIYSEGNKEKIPLEN